MTTSASIDSSPIDVTAPNVITGAPRDQFADVLTPAALEFVGQLAREFAPRIDDLLSARAARRAAWAAGKPLGFRADTVNVREGEWRIDPVPKELMRRVVEITGPTDRKMIINALNSGADTFMADLEDSTSPTWDNIVQGQVNLRDAVRRTISHTDPDSGKAYRLSDTLAVLLVRPRGLHLPESHITHDRWPACSRRTVRRWDVSLSQCACATRARQRSVLLSP